MICPNCKNACGERDHFCCRCGSPLQEAVPAKKGALWVPVLILILLSAIGIAVFFCTAPGKRHAHSSADAPWFAVQNGVLYFDESRYAGSGELSVPNQVDGETVTSLSDGCFRNLDHLTTVILPDTLTTIGRGAFAGCSSLRGIYIPASVTEIGAGAFSGCTGLEAVCINPSVERIGQGAFEDCNQLYYIFYLGTYDDWNELFTEFITPYTGVYCLDGSFRQG